MITRISLDGKELEPKKVEVGDTLSIMIPIKVNGIVIHKMELVITLLKSKGEKK